MNFTERVVQEKRSDIKAVAEASLKRLKVEAIDLFYQHRVDPDVPIEDVAGAVKDLIQEGKVKHFGLSAAGVATIPRAHAVQRVTVVQSEYSSWTQDPEPEVLPTLEAPGIGLAAYSPLGKGHLAGKMNDQAALDQADFQRMLPRFAPEALEQNKALIDLIAATAASKGATVAQVAIAWVLARKPWIAPIPGTTTMERLLENIGAAELELTPGELQDLDAVSSVTIHGARYPENILKMVGR